MRKVLLTGCTGTIGSGITKRLLDLDFTVYGISNQKTCRIRHPKHVCQSVNLLLTDVNVLVDFVKPDILVHTSWVTEHQEFWNSELNESWVLKTNELVKAFSKNPTGYFLGIGSCAEYDLSVNKALTVGAHEGPVTPYGKSKLKALDLITDSGVDFGWGRVFYQYTLEREDQKVVSKLFHHALTNRELTIQNPNNLFDFVYKDDVVENLVRMIVLGHPGIVNLGSGKSESIKSIANFIEERLDRKLFSLSDADGAPISNVLADVANHQNLGFQWRSVYDVLDASELWLSK